MEFVSTVEFAHVARALSRALAHSEVVAPSFRCPPRLVGVDRSIRRRGGDGSVVVSIRVKGRPREAVVADMIEGVVVANRLASPAADRLRSQLWAAAVTESPTNPRERPAA
ncbi:MAG: hypothetical protein AB8G26_11030 [Ilumatobacter sp.]